MGCPSAAFYWAKDPKVRREVNACRRRALNQAIGRLTGMAMNAVDGMAHLAKGADSESVQLRAWRGILADLMSVSKFSVLEYRMTEIEEELDKRGLAPFVSSDRTRKGWLVSVHRAKGREVMSGEAVDRPRDDTRRGPVWG